MPNGRQLTQLISVAKHYLDAAASLIVASGELNRTVSTDSAGWSADRLPRPLSPLDEFSAHLGSCATRLATIHEILVDGTSQAWATAYPNDAAITDENLDAAVSRAIEILLRDNVAHAEDPATKGKKKSEFRNAALGRLTFQELREKLRRRYEALALECVAKSDW